MSDEALENSLYVVGKPREEPYGAERENGDPRMLLIPEEKKDYEERQWSHRYWVPSSDPKAKLSTEEEQFIALVKRRGSTKGYLVFSGVPIQRVMVPIVNTEDQIGEYARLTEYMFGGSIVSIVYPKRRSSIHYDWRYTFSYIFRALGVEPDDGVPIIMLCASAKNRIVQDFPALTPEEMRFFELTLNYWCEFHFESMQGRLFRQLYYLLCCAYKSRNRKYIKLSPGNGSPGELDVITSLIRMYLPKDSVDPSLLSKIPRHGITTFFFGKDSKAMIN